MNKYVLICGTLLFAVAIVVAQRQIDITGQVRPDRVAAVKILLNGYEPITSVPPQPPNPPYLRNLAPGDPIGTYKFAAFQIKTAAHQGPGKSVDIQVDAYVEKLDASGTLIASPAPSSILTIKNKKSKISDGYIWAIDAKKNMVVPEVTYKVPTEDTHIAFVATFRYPNGNERPTSVKSIDRVILKKP